MQELRLLIVVQVVVATHLLVLRHELIPGFANVPRELIFFVLEPHCNIMGKFVVAVHRSMNCCTGVNGTGRIGRISSR